MLISRRTFLQTTLMTGVATAAGPTYPAEPSGEGFIDVHTHLSQNWGPKQPLTVTELLRWMDANRVTKACVLPLINPESWFHPVTTDYVLRETRPHRDRLIPFCSIDPRTVNLNEQAKLDLLHRYIEAGAKGFGEHKPGISMDDPRNIALFRLCAEAGLPVLFHLDTLRNTDKPGLRGLEFVLREIPEGVFIGHAQGFWANISGEVSRSDMQGYPKGQVAPGGALDRLMERYPNLYGDLSAGSGANAIGRDPAFGLQFLIRHADRLLFGTDYLEPGQQVPQFELYMDTLKLPSEVAQKIFHANARRILRL